MRRLLILLLVAASFGLIAQGAVPCAVLQTQPACAAALKAGPAEATAPSVHLAGARTYASSGQFVLTTVSVDVNVDFGEWVRYGFDPRVDQMRRDAFILPEEDPAEAERRNQLSMGQSQFTAALAALRHLGFDAPNGAEVMEVVTGSAAAEARLEPGDVVVGFAGQPVTSAEELVEAVGERSVGDAVELTVERADERRTVTATLQDAPAGHGDGPSLGVQVRSALPLDVEIDAGVIGGPSAGLLFALTIIDMLGPEDLTGGRVIAGTGTIDPSGNVGPIGGVRQKVLGALSRGEQPPAEVFLVPAGNFDEARSAPVDGRILLVPVATLGDALEALSELRAGREPASALALGP